MASAGVCIQTAICPYSATIRAVSTTATTAKSQMPVPTMEAVLRSSFAPVAMPINTVIPVVSPRMTPVTVCIT